MVNELRLPPSGDSVLRHGGALARRVGRGHRAQRGIACPVVVLVVEELDRHRLLGLGVVEQEDLGNGQALWKIIALDPAADFLYPLLIDSIERYDACECHRNLLVELGRLYALRDTRGLEESLASSTSCESSPRVVWGTRRALPVGGRVPARSLAARREHGSLPDASAASNPENWIEGRSPALTDGGPAWETAPRTRTGTALRFRRAAAKRALRPYGGRRGTRGERGVSIPKPLHEPFAYPPLVLNEQRGPELGERIGRRVVERQHDALSIDDRKREHLRFELIGLLETAAVGSPTSSAGSRSARARAGRSRFVVAEEPAYDSRSKMGRDADDDARMLDPVTQAYGDATGRTVLEP